MRVFVGVLLAVGLGVPAYAERWNQIPDAEVNLLPQYCQVRMRQLNSPAYKALEQVMGPDLLHTHHYCAGLVYLKRYYGERERVKRSFHLESARANLAYMVKNASPTYSLMPDIYFSLGETYRLSGSPGRAREWYEKAIKTNPALPRPYGSLADMLSQSGKSSQALEIVTEGLRHNPDTSTLQRRYRELGGKLPYPEPVAKAAAVPADPTPSPATAAQTPTPTSAASPEAAPVAVSETPPSVVPAEPPKPKIGSPTNPYCRFCAD